MVLATGVIIRALHERANFYSACVYLAQSNACLMVGYGWHLPFSKNLCSRHPLGTYEHCASRRKLWNARLAEAVLRSVATH